MRAKLSEWAEAHLAALLGRSAAQPRDLKGRARLLLLRLLRLRRRRLVGWRHARRLVGRRRRLNPARACAAVPALLGCLLLVLRREARRMLKSVPSGTRITSSVPLDRRRALSSSSAAKIHYGLCCCLAVTGTPIRDEHMLTPARKLSCPPT
jgi:hypothetical protein